MNNPLNEINLTAVIEQLKVHTHHIKSLELDWSESCCEDGSTGTKIKMPTIRVEYWQPNEEIVP